MAGPKRGADSCLWDPTEQIRQNARNRLAGEMVSEGLSSPVNA